MFYSKLKTSAATAAAKVLWRMPGRFQVAKLAGSSCSLRCLVFHNISPKKSPFTVGMNVTTAPEDFEATLRFLTTYYTPVSLEDVLSDGDGRGLPGRPVLVTFDDAYASVAQYAAPLCKHYGVPAVFFVNAAFVGNQRLAPDNLICYVAATSGLANVNAAVRAVAGHENQTVHTLSEVFDIFLPSISLSERAIFLEALAEETGVDESAMAMDAQLYLTRKHLFELRAFNFEIGNHTYSHPHCRMVSEDEFTLEVDQNKADLESMCGTKVRSFSVPYGSSRDLTGKLKNHLEASGYQAVFLSESVANQPRQDLFHLDRVNPQATHDERRFLEVELLPRMRALRNGLLPRRRDGQSMSVDSKMKSPTQGSPEVGTCYTVSDRGQTRV